MSYLKKVSTIILCVAICLVGLVNAWNNSNALLGTLKVFLDDLDSSCFIFLYTRQHYDMNRSEITRLIRQVAGNVDDFDVGVVGFTFERFLKLYKMCPSCLHCKSPTVLVAHEDEDTRQRLLTVTQEVTMHNMMWIWYGGMRNVSNFLPHLILPFSCLFIVAHEINESYVEMRQVYRVAKGYPLHNDYYGYWSPSQHFIPLEIMYNWRFDLEGLLFRTGSTQNAPVHSFEQSEGGRLELVGYFPEVWKQLETIMNFTSVHYPSEDNVTGILENGSWSGLIGMLQRNKIDVAVSDFIMDTQRTHVVEFSLPLVKSSYQLFFKNVGDNLNWDAILRPFDIDTWLTILVWLVVVSSVMAFVNFCECKYHLRQHGNADDFNLVNSFLFYLKTICFQGHNVVPIRTTTRILFLMGYLTACVLYPSYSASLISYLTLRTPRRPFDNLLSLLDTNTYKLQTNSKTAEYTYFSEATDPTLQRIFKELMSKDLEDYPLNTQEALERVCSDPHLAHFGDMSVAATYLDHVRQVMKCDIVTLSKGIGTVYSSMAFRPNSHYRFAINHFLHRMEDSGLVRRIYWAIMSTNKKNIQPVNEKVQLIDVAQIFILLSIGHIVAVTILFLEIIYCRFTRRRHQQPKFNTELILN